MFCPSLVKQILVFELWTEIFHNERKLLHVGFICYCLLESNLLIFPHGRINAILSSIIMAHGIKVEAV